MGASDVGSGWGSDWMRMLDLHGAAEDDVGHLRVDLEVADAAAAVAGDGLDEGCLSRARHAVEEIGPARGSGQQTKMTTRLLVFL